MCATITADGSHWAGVRRTRSLAAVLVLALLANMLPGRLVAGDTPAESPPSGSTSTARIPPTRRVYTMSPEAYRRVEPVLRRQALEGGVTVVEVAQLPEATAGALDGRSGNTRAVTNVVDETGGARITVPPHHAPHPVPPAQAPHPPPGPESCTHNCLGAFDLLADIGSPGWGDNDAAVVIFVVIGVVVVATVVVYAGAFLYEAVLGTGEYSYWWDVEAQASAIIKSGDTGHLTGIKLSSGFENPHARVGLVAEAGSIDIEVDTGDGEPPPSKPDGPPGDGTQLDPMPVPVTEVAGSFVMAGAGIRWPFGGADGKRHFFGLELLAGGSSDRDVDLISTARADISFGIGEHTRLGATLGALYLDLDPEDTLVQDTDSFSTLIGLHAGFRF